MSRRIALLSKKGTMWDATMPPPSFVPSLHQSLLRRSSSSSGSLGKGGICVPHHAFHLQRRHLQSYSRALLGPAVPDGRPSSLVDANDGPNAAAADTQRFSFSIPSLSLAPPQSMTHEHLAYARCPICRQYLHMCDLYLHLTSKHKELNPKHCQKMCNTRLELYQKEIGVKLVKDSTLSSTAMPNDVFGGAPAIRNGNKLVDDFLPTLLDGGGYLCNLCTRRDVVHATRDQFLKHVTMEHPEIDVDDLDEKIPRQQSSRQHRAPAGDAQAISSPRRRLANVVQGTAEAAVSVPPPPSLTSTTPKPQLAGRPSAGDFQCELCGKQFPTELFILQHFENAHPYGELGKPTLVSNSGASSSPSRVDLVDDIRNIAKFQQMDSAVTAAGRGGGAPFLADCDLCAPKQMRFTLPSALYAHLTTKHPHVDAVAELKRLSKKNVLSFPCTVCRRNFGSKTALEAHFNEKHGAKAASNTGGGDSSSDGPMVNVYWCHSCEKGFTSARGLHGHLTGKHGLPSEVHPCPACKRVFGDAYSLEEHVGLVHKSIAASSLAVALEFACSECERVFLLSSDRSSHMAKHHPAAEGRRNGNVASSSVPTVPRRASRKPQSISKGTEGTPARYSFLSPTELEPELLGKDKTEVKSKVSEEAKTTEADPGAPQGSRRVAASPRRVAVRTSLSDTTSIRAEDIEIV